MKKNNITPITGQTLSEQVFDELKEAIISGEITQGSKITEDMLAKKYGISRGPLREAIRKLEGIRLLVRIPHAGTRVVTLTQTMMEEIYTVREALEGMSARLAAERMNDAEIDNLRQLLEKHESNIDQSEGKEYFQREGDLDFHYCIARASNNEFLMQLLSSELYQLLRICRYQSSQAPERPLKALNEHRQIVEAIANRDPELAEILMRRHINGAWNIVKNLFKSENDKSTLKKEYS
ncbi:MAG: GntR family transcriptional regulator [Cocleimonas sp.]